MTVRTHVSPLGRMRMLAGDPALDFANTLHWRSGRQVDFIPDYVSLLDWSVPAGLLREAEVNELTAAALSEPTAARSVHGRIIALREAWRTYLDSAIGRQDAEPQSDFSPPLAAALADFLAQGQPLLALAAPSSASDTTLALPGFRIALAIASLHLIPVDRQLGRCEGDPCGGFFLNTSRSKPRRWCSMDTCGNREKVRQFRSRSAADAGN